MKILLLVITLIFASSSVIASQSSVQKKKTESCFDVMEKVKKVNNKELFVGFVSFDEIKNVRKDFPDLHFREVKAFKTCVRDHTEGDVENLLIITIPNTTTNAKHLSTYRVKSAG
jgi:hypothetical protein